MTEIIAILLTLIFVGGIIYFFRYRNKGKPKVGIKRNNFSEYLKDFTEFQLYWTSLSFIVLGIVVLIAILIVELAFM